MNLTPDTIADVDPRDLAAQIVASRPDPAWLDAFATGLADCRSGRQLHRILDVWGLSQAEFAALMGVSRQAVGKWLDQRLPADRAVAVADLAAATDLLVHYISADRIAAVVRRPASALDDRSLIDLVASGDTGAVLAACRAMFDPTRAHA